MINILFFFFFAAGALVLAVQYYTVRTIYYRHRAAARFRVVKCSVIDVLFNEAFSQKEMEQKDLLALRKIYAQLGYDLEQLKGNADNFFSASNFLRLSIQGIRQQQLFPDEFKHEHTRVLQERRKAADAMLYAFGVLVPWLRFRVFYMLLRLWVRILLLLGKTQLKTTHEMLGTSSVLAMQIKMAAAS
ncbi:MAG: hypothetical protein ACRC3B_23735 [Bacteroidia bacterium]